MINNSQLSSFILAGGLGACFGHLISDLVPIVFYMDNADITSQGSSSGAQGPSSSGGLNLPQGSSSGDQSDIDSLMKRINDLTKISQQNVIGYRVEQYLDLRKAYKDLYNKEINRVDTLLVKYSAYMDTSLKTRYAELVHKFAIETAAFNEKFKLFTDVNDPLGTIRLLLDKQKFDLSNDMQIKSGNIVREAVLKSYKNKQISQEETKAFMDSWLQVVKDRPQIRQNIFSEIDKLQGIGKSINTTIIEASSSSSK